MISIYLKPGRDKSLLRHHPWVFSGAIAGMDCPTNEMPEDGATVQVVDSSRRFLGWGAYSSKSQIRVRIWSWDPDELINSQFFRSQIARALTMRSEILESQMQLLPTNAVRLIHGESDGLPGLVVDRYDDTLVVQFLSSGPEFWRGTLIEMLIELTGVSRVYERSDAVVRHLEGLPDKRGLLYGGSLSGHSLIFENSLKFYVDISQGHKTGFYLDQRDNRAMVGKMARGRSMLDCFAYSGGFSIYALAGGAESVLAIESSVEALNLARENLALNQLPSERVDFQQADAFQALRSFRDQGRKFDLIVLDPPKFAPTASHVKQAARGYKDINLLALKLLRPGGLLFTFSCSGGVDADLFQKIVAGAALDAGVDGQILGRLEQGFDHPVALNFPEGTYLKGLIVRV